MKSTLLHLVLYAISMIYEYNGDGKRVNELLVTGTGIEDISG